MKPFARMIEDDALSAELRADVARALAEPESYDVDKGEARLVAALGLGVGADAMSSTQDALGEAAAQASGSAALGSSSLWGSTVAKVCGALAAGALVVTGALVWPRSSPPQAPGQPAPPSAEPPSAAPPAIPEAAVEPPTPEKAAEKRARPSSSGQQSAAHDADAALRREIEQLGAIRALLETDPARAYRLAEAGHRQFARGMLREEREALAVLALWRVGRAREAEARGRAFLARYPHSAHREAIERNLYAEPGPDEPRP